MKKITYIMALSSAIALAASLSVYAKNGELKRFEKNLHKVERFEDQHTDKAEHEVQNLEHLADKLDTFADIPKPGPQSQMLNIGPKGEVHLMGGSVTGMSSSTLTVSVWKISFTVHNMPDTHVMAQGGGQMSFDRIKVGDIVDVKGQLDDSQAAFIHADAIRDRSAFADARDAQISQLRQRIQEMIERLNKLLGKTTPPPAPTPTPTPPPSSTDTSAPSVPANVSGQAASTTQINLSWSAATDNVGVTGYKIYRCTGTGCTPSDQLVMVSGTSYQDTGLNASTIYGYAVAAYDAAGNVSGKSTSVSVTTQAQVQAQADTVAPTVPSSLSAGIASASSTQVNLAWLASYDAVGVTGYKIYRCAGAGCTPTSQIDTSISTSYQNTGLSASTTYVYSVAAYDAAGNVSANSSPASVTTP